MEGIKAYSMGLFLLSTYKRRPPPPHSTTHKGREQEERATLQGLGHNYLELCSKERCEGEFREVWDLSIFPRLYLDEHLYLDKIFC
jgi:hypothetical protein